MQKFLLAVLGAVLFMACSAGDGHEPVEVLEAVPIEERHDVEGHDFEDPGTTAIPTLDELSEYYIAFRPEPELHDVTVAAVERWRAATGLDLRISDDGIPIEAIDRVLTQNADYPEVCGWARLWEKRIWIAVAPEVSCAEPSVVVTHEIGHAIFGDGRHSSGGVMSAGKVDPTTRHLIEETTLELVCSSAPCRIMRPETLTPDGGGGFR
jgi:hypothetical protein